jgi:hypothetical protein
MQTPFESVRTVWNEKLKILEPVVDQTTEYRPTSAQAAQFKSDILRSADELDRSLSQAVELLLETPE